MATQYFEHKLELGNFSEQAHFQLMEWHPALNILAAGSVNVGTNIFFYGEDVSAHAFVEWIVEMTRIFDQGEHDEAARIQHSSNAYCMAWHPVKKTLAIGFSSRKTGMIDSFVEEATESDSV